MTANLAAFRVVPLGILVYGRRALPDETGV
jgi:hypothetical protein